MHVTTAVRVLSGGRPARGGAGRLESADGEVLASGATDEDGRVGTLGPARLASGTYLLRFSTGDYLKQNGNGGEAFFPEVAICFVVSADQAHYHVPLLLSRYGYSTYRGS